MSKPHQPHKRILFENLDKGFWAEGLFKQGGHNALHLSERVVTFSKHRGTALSRLQRLALDRFHNEEIFNLAKPTQHTITILNAYTHFFNELFFFGSLRDRITVEYERDRTSEMMGFNGRCMKAQQKKKEFKILELLKKKKDSSDDRWRFEIQIFGREGEIRHRSKRILQYVTTLAHELIHAFLNTWTCGYEPCRKGWEALGVSGHGKAWQDIAYAIEKALNDVKFLNLGIDMRRESSLALELVKEGRETASVGQGDLKKWRLHEDELTKEFDRLNRQTTRGKKLPRSEAKRG